VAQWPNLKRVITPISLYAHREAVKKERSDEPRRVTIIQDNGEWGY